jgi:hypothetical protein
MYVHPPRRVAPQWMVVAGFTVMGITQPTTDADTLISAQAWSLAAYVVAIVGAFTVITRPSLRHHTLWTSLVVAFAGGRIIDFMFVGRWVGVGVWLAVIGLAWGKFKAIARYQDMRL